MAYNMVVIIYAVPLAVESKQQDFGRGSYAIFSTVTHPKYGRPQFLHKNGCGYYGTLSTMAHAFLCGNFGTKS